MDCLCSGSARRSHATNRSKNLGNIFLVNNSVGGPKTEMFISLKDCDPAWLLKDK